MHILCNYIIDNSDRNEALNNGVSNDTINAGLDKDIMICNLKEGQFDVIPTPPYRDGADIV